jgi:maltose alpha-D-glucosyltransferase/alpha-amylase
VHPIIDDGPYGVSHINVEKQKRDPGSLLRWMTRMVHLRKECPEIGWGTWSIIDAKLPNVLAMLYEWRGSQLLVVHNFEGQRHSVSLPLRHRNGERLVDLLAEEESQPDKRGTHRIVLEAYGYRWFRVA